MIPSPSPTSRQAPRSGGPGGRDLGPRSSFVVRRSPFVLLAVVTLAAALRGYRLDAQSLWYDEGVSAFMTTRGPVEIARAAAADIHPPLYYWLLAAWAVPFGNGEVALRGLSVVAGTLGVWVVWRLARRLYDDAVGLAAAALLAVSPLAVQYGQEVRMYALAGLLAAASTWAYVRLVGCPRARARKEPPSGAAGAVIYAFLAAALLYTHYYGALVLAAHQLHALGSIALGRRRDLLAAWLLASGLVAALYLPWLPHALRQTGSYPGLGTPRSAWALVLDAVNVLSLGIATTRFELRLALVPFLALALLGLGQGPGIGGQEPGVRGEGSGGHPLARLWAPALGLWPPAPGSWSLLLALWLAIPIGGIAVLSASRPLYEPRFLMLVLPAWVILVAAGVVVLGRAAGRLVGRGGLPPTTRGVIAGALAAGLLGMLLVPTVRSLASYYFDPTYARDDYRGLASRVAELERPADAVVLTAPGQAEIFGYYYRGNADLFPLPAQRPIDPADTLARLQALAAGHRRVWLVRWAAGEADPDDLIGRWLREHARAAGTERFGRVELYLYDLTAQARGAGGGTRDA